MCLLIWTIRCHTSITLLSHIRRYLHLYCFKSSVPFLISTPFHCNANRASHSDFKIIQLHQIFNSGFKNHHLALEKLKQQVVLINFDKFRKLVSTTLNIVQHRFPVCHHYEEWHESNRNQSFKKNQISHILPSLKFVEFERQIFNCERRLLFDHLNMF